MGSWAEKIEAEVMQRAKVLAKEAKKKAIKDMEAPTIKAMKTALDHAQWDFYSSYSPKNYIRAQDMADVGIFTFNSGEESFDYDWTGFMNGSGMSIFRGRIVSTPGKYSSEKIFINSFIHGIHGNQYFVLQSFPPYDTFREMFDDYLTGEGYEMYAGLVQKYFFTLWNKG